MIEDISSPVRGKRGSWTETSSTRAAQHSAAVFPVEQGRSHADRALIVYQNVRRPSTETTEVNELLIKARVVLPAILNYLYFGSTQVAVVYFGKRVTKKGIKTGIREGAQDLKIRLVRYFTSEMWPPLLRTDAPDESLGLDYLNNSHMNVSNSSFHSDAGGTATYAAGPPAAAASGSAGTTASVLEAVESVGRVGPAADTAARLAKEVEQERLWFRRSIENQMQVLLYLKNSTDGKSKYLKVVLQNTAHRLYFDVTDAKEEKYRWDLRMLFTRMMDNLETQKAIDSYESYLEYFREACAVAAKNALFLERPRQSMLEVVLWTKPKRLHPAPAAESGEFTMLPPNLLAAQRCCDNHDGTVASSPDVVSSPLLLLPPTTAAAAAGAVDTSPPGKQSSLSGGDDTDPELAVTQVLTRRCSGAASAEWSVHCVRVKEDTLPPPPPLRPAPSSRRTTPALHATAAPLTVSPTIGASALRSPNPGMPSASLLSPTTLGARHSYTARKRSYQWMSNLQKPESATLDYKSYFFNTAIEIRHRCVKFMCGFLNAYGEGKLVVGVHEIPRTTPTNAEERKEEGTKIVVHNDMVDQFVVGARVSGEELECLQVDVSEQLLCCIPPIPPRAVQVDAVPVRFPKNFTYASHILVLYDFANPFVSARDALKQKSNYAIRFLFTLGLSIVPLDLPTAEVREMLEAAHAENSLSDAMPADVDWDDVNTEAYLIAAVDDPAALSRSGWEEKLANSLNRHKQRCFHAILEYGPTTHKTLVLPELFILEVSVDIKRCGYGPLIKYKGKFFAGWPSIPVWDPTTRSVRAVERNYNVLALQPAAQMRNAWARLHAGRGPAGLPASSGVVSSNTNVFTSPGQNATTSSSSALTATGAGGAAAVLTSSSSPQTQREAVRDSFQRQLVQDGLAWFAQPTIMARVLAFLYNPLSIRDILQFRLIHPLTNVCFENRQGIYLVQMIYSTPVGVPIFNSPPEQLSRVQYSFLHAGVPTLPLLLCRCYEMIGNLPSPYPFVAVPLVQQTFRVAPCLVPLFYRQHYFDGQLRLAVVLDLRDSLLKTVDLRNGNLMLDTIVGIGFEPMNKRQLMRHFLRRRQRSTLRMSNNGLAGTNTEHDGDLRDESPAAVEDNDDEDDVLLRHSFIARRVFQPQALTHSTDSHMGSLIMSPRSVELLHATTEREVEADIPLLHFSFLSRKAVEKGNYLKPEELPRSWHRTATTPGSDRATRPSPSLAPSPEPQRNPRTPPPLRTVAAALESASDAAGAACLFPQTPPPASAVAAATNSEKDAGMNDASSDVYAESADAAAMGAPVAHGRPWTLQHLLYWYNAFLTDREHYSVFGCGNRSVAFRVSSLSEVCTACVEPGAVEAVNASSLSRDDSRCAFAPDREACVLHRKVHDWLAV